jgi:hypothetical protein
LNWAVVCFVLIGVTVLRDAPGAAAAEGQAALSLPWVGHQNGTPSTSRFPIVNGAFKQLGVSDSHGTWLAGEDGIYLLDSNDKIVKVSDVTGGTVAGACN